MSDIRNPKLLYLKGLLFLCLGCLAAGLLLAEHFTLKAGLLLAVAIWAFCRAYYFAFYVVEHYADPEYRFSGLLSFVRYLLSSKSDPRRQP